MKRLLLIGFATCALVALPALSASAMPQPSSTQPTVGSDNAIVLVKGGHGHGRGHMGRGGRGHHYGWGRGRHRGWR